MILLRTLMIGAFGGLAAWAVGLPAPWLAGSLVATLVAVGCSLPLSLPAGLRKTAFILLGLQTGLSVTPDTIERAQHWPLSLLALAVTVIIIVWVCTRYFERVAGWSRASALFASLPGALSLVLLLAEGSYAEMRKVIVAQCIRLVLLVVMLPVIIRAIAPPPALAAGLPVASIPQLMVLALASAAGGLLLEWMKVPAGLILGACLASAALVLGGWFSAASPDALLIPANIVLGVMIGMRLEGTSWRDLQGIAGAGLAAFLLALLLALGGAALTSWFTELPLALTILAFAPGGLEAMTIMAFALNLDPAFVAAHQVVRYVGLVVLMPWVTRAALGRAAVAKPARTEESGAE